MVPVIRVLLVDDHQVVREGLKHVLASCEDIEVVGEATCGEDALVQAQRLKPDIVLMDIKMPGMDGIEATRKLREMMPGIRVIMLTLYDEEYVTQAVEAGASGYLLKDASSQQLIQAIHDACRGYSPLTPSLTREILSRLAEFSRTSGELLLSSRQREILRLIASGLSRKEVAARLYISEATVKKELSTIFDRLGVSDQTQAVAEAMKRRLI